MTKLKLFTIGTSLLFFILACSNKTESVLINQTTNLIDTLNIGCLGSYDINPANNKEKINQVYGKDQIKDGHWIVFGLTKNTDKKVSRVKLEEGYYRKNKKVGFWKIYNEGGTLKDSIEYKNNQTSINKSKFDKTSKSTASIL